jgi:hypothetical protein
MWNHVVGFRRMTMVQLGLTLLAFFHLVAAHADDALFAKAVERMTPILAKRVVALDRELVTFHYETSYPGWTPTKLNQIQHHILSWPSHFFDTSVLGDAVGRGIYVAIDPVATRSYGGTQGDPQLYVITLKKGAVLLNGTDDLPEAEMQEMWSIANSLNCTSGKTAGTDLTTPIEQILQSQSEDCRKIVTVTLANLKVEAIAYNYSGVGLSDCRSRQVAINIVSPNAIKAEDLALYTDSIQLEGTPLAALTRRLFEEGFNDYTTRVERASDTGYEIPRTLMSTPVAADPIYSNWRSAKIFACGPRWSFEFPIGPFEYINDTIANANSDPELRELLLQLSRGYSLRFTPNAGFTTVVSYQLNQLQRMDYDNSGFDPKILSYQQWRDIRNSVFSDGTDKQAFINAAKSLGEPSNMDAGGSYLDIVHQTESRFTLNDAKNPAFIPAMFHAMGMGPRLARLLANFSIAAFGGAPFMTALPDKISSDAVALEKANIEKFKEIAKKCIATYNDLTLSDTQVKTGPCGTDSPP